MLRLQSVMMADVCMVVRAAVEPGQDKLKLKGSLTSVIAVRLEAYSASVRLNCESASLWSSSGNISSAIRKVASSFHWTTIANLIRNCWRMYERPAIS